MKNYITRRNNDFLEDAFDGFFRPFYVGEDTALMKTDIKENEKEYVLDIEMPGFAKEEENERYIRRERSVKLSRSYYMGDVDQTLIKAKYDNGVLTVTVPKEKPENAKHVITVE